MAEKEGRKDNIQDEWYLKKPFEEKLSLNFLFKYLLCKFVVNKKHFR